MVREPFVSSFVSPFMSHGIFGAQGEDIAVQHLHPRQNWLNYMQ
jgi:hypothetical protein